MGKIINLINIHKKEQKYLGSLGADSMENLSLDQGNQLFISVIKDFKAGILTLDELSVFGFSIFHGAGKKYPKSDLFQSSLSASELNFAVRSEAVYDNISLYLKDIDRFYQKYSL